MNTYELIPVEEQTDAELLQTIRGSNIADSVRLAAACELLSRRESER